MNPPIEVTSVRPTKKVVDLGSVTHKNRKTTAKNAGVSGQAHLAFMNFLHVRGGGGARRADISRAIEDYRYPKQVVVSNSMAAANHAVWTFEQAGSTGIDGEYVLTINFRIRKPASKIKTGRGIYEAIPEIYVNNEKLNISRDTRLPLKPIPIEFLV